MLTTPQEVLKILRERNLSRQTIEEPVNYVFMLFKMIFFGIFIMSLIVGFLAPVFLLITLIQLGLIVGFCSK